MNSYKSSVRCSGRLSLILAALWAIMLPGPLAHGQTLPCIETNGVKFLLPPQTDQGFDVKDSRDNIVLADDFFCNTAGPITDIHVWGSWLADQHGTITNFWIGIYNDVPAVTNSLNGQITWSHPGTNLLWSQNFGLGQFSETIYTNGNEYFYNPANNTILGGDSFVWYYCFYPTNPFIQQGSANAPTNYWLAIRAQIQDTNTQILYGWKSALVPYNDPAVWGTVLATSGLPLGNWQSMTNPFSQQPLHLSMKLTTPTNTPPPQGCVETNGTKYVQWPNLNQGFDVWDDGPWVLADDFICTNSGPITDIHLWGSWLNDQVHTNSLKFWLAIYDDVPASGNTNSHPGNLLWQEQFVPGEYIDSFWAFGTESFLDPGPPNVMGSDSQVRYYCFYPTNIFTQQGTFAAPKIYWLMVYAQDTAPTSQPFGWKTTTNIQHDVSVHAPWPGSPPVGNPGWIKTQQASTGGPLDLAFKITTATNNTPTPCCPETNGVKWLQRPNTSTGVDIDFFSTHNGGIVLADDFKCTNSGAITDIHLWGSWTGDVPNPSQFVTLGIWSDVPVSATNSFSHPGINLWTQTFTNGQYTICPYTNAPETTYGYTFFPGSLSVYGNTTNLYYLCFFPTNPFVQTGSTTAPTNFWLSVYAPPYLNWKSSLDSYNDSAVAGNFPGANWIPISDPTSTQPLNFSFKITTATNNQPPPTGCVETNGVKYVQWPNPFGYDVWNSTPFPPGVTDGPWVLADDFICTNTGPITDIHLWGSWLNNQVSSNTTTFWIAMFADVPANPPNVPFSHPGGLIWEQCFAPGQYSESLYGSGQEYFLDPGPPQIVGSDSQIWYYCFYPTNPPIQQGSTSNPKTYWLAVFAQMPTGSQSPFGWKTTTNVQHDISVHAPWPGVFCPTNITGTGFPWTPTFDTFNSPLDLAFKLTTTTNHCIVPIACPVDKNVECGSSWAFDPPTVGSDPCCATPPTVTLTVVTNSNAPCNQKYAGIWTVTDCTGTVLGVCTQNVTVVDTTPPVITCASNKTVQCGTAWNFDNPTALDACCGTNVTINLVSTVTNTPACPLVVTRTWTATDCCTNTSTPCSQTVTVVDTNPPTIICPSNIVVFTCGTNAIVFWTITATDTCSSVTVTSSPPSGTAFLPNTTNTVVATARDACGNTNSCSFTVAVRRPVLGPVFIQYVVTNKVVLTWTNGILMVSTNVLGPYVDVPGATSPYTNTTLPMPPTNRFYRLRCNSP